MRNLENLFSFFKIKDQFDREQSYIILSKFVMYDIYLVPVWFTDCTTTHGMSNDPKWETTSHLDQINTNTSF